SDPSELLRLAEPDEQGKAAERGVRAAADEREAIGRRRVGSRGQMATEKGSLGSPVGPLPASRSDESDKTNPNGHPADSLSQFGYFCKGSNKALHSPASLVHWRAAL